MCFICDGGSHDEFLRLMASHIEEFGWDIAGVEPTELQPGWSYTVGLSERFDHPELVVTGARCGHRAVAALETTAACVAAGVRLGACDELHLDDGRRLRIGPVHPRHWQTSLFASWLAYYEDKPWAPPRRALQVIMFDRDGRWQDDRRNRSWRRFRLDRPPHLPGNSRR